MKLTAKQLRQIIVEEVAAATMPVVPEWVQKEAAAQWTKQQITLGSTPKIAALPGLEAAFISQFIEASDGGMRDVRSEQVGTILLRAIEQLI